MIPPKSNVVKSWIHGVTHSSMDLLKAAMSLKISFQDEWGLTKAASLKLTTQNAIRNTEYGLVSLAIVY